MSHHRNLKVQSFDHKVTQLNDEWGMVHYVASNHFTTLGGCEWWYVYHVPCIKRCIVTNDAYKLADAPETCARCQAVVPAEMQGMIDLCRSKGREV
jgi:hypothetical protein